MNIFYPRILRLYSCLFLCGSIYPYVNAQVALVAPTLEATTGATLTANLRLRTADTLGSLQFTFAWDSAVLQFVSVQNFGLIGTSEASNFNLTTVNNGKLRFLWDDTRLQGVAASDSVTVFSVTFRAIGASNTRSDLRFDSVPVKIRASTVNGTSLRIGTVRQGYVRLTPRTASAEILDAPATLSQNFPNPFQTDTRFELTLPQSETVQITLCDVAGNRLFETQQYFNSGTQTIDLVDFVPFPNWKNGIYFFSIKMKSKTLIQKIIKYTIN